MSSHPIADIKSIEDYNKAKSDENIAVILFNDDTVEQCRFMTGVMEELRKDESLKFVQFYKLAAKEMRETEFRELCRNHEVEHVPTVIVLIAGKEEERIDGANAARLSKKVDHYAKKKALETRIKKLISAQKVMLLMRGTCAEAKDVYSDETVAILDELQVEYGTFNILSDNEVREGLKTFLGFKEFPQLYIDGELVGGWDIIKRMHESGQLRE